LSQRLNVFASDLSCSNKFVAWDLPGITMISALTNNQGFLLLSIFSIEISEKESGVNVT